MDEPFELPITYKGEELLFPARLLQIGYTHRFAVDVYGQEVFFEPDEERNYRALIDAAHLESNKKISVDLLQAIAEGIEAILK
jgi:hypothetical protein